MDNLTMTVLQLISTMNLSAHIASNLLLDLLKLLLIPKYKFINLGFLEDL